MADLGPFSVEGAFSYATATDARTAKRSYGAKSNLLGANAPPLAALASFTTKDARFAGEVAGCERELQEKRWCVTLQALREAADRASGGQVDVVLSAWRDRHRVLAGGSLLRAPAEPPEGARRLGGAGFRTQRVKSLASAPDGSWIAVGAESSDHFMSLAVRIRTLESDGSASTADVRLFRLDGTLLQVFSLDVAWVHELWVRPDGAALGAATSHGLFGLDRASGRCHSLKRGGEARYVAGSPSGAWVAGAVERDLCFFDAVTWKKIHALKLSEKDVYSLFACGERLVVGERKRGIVYDGTGNVVLERPDLAGKLRRLPDGRVHAEWSGLILDLDTGASEQGPAWPYGEPARNERLVLPVPGGGRFLTYEKDCVVERPDGTAGPRIPVPNVLAAVVAKDRVYLGGATRLVPVDITTGVARLDGHAGKVCALSYADDGRLASLGWAGEILVWDVLAGIERSRIPIGYAAGDQLVWLPDGFATTWSNHLYLVRMDGARDELELPATPKCMCASPDGRWLVAGCYQKLLALDLARGELHVVDIPDWVEDVAFVGDRLAVACYRELAILDLDTRRFVATTPFGANWLTVADGRATAWGSGGRLVVDAKGEILARGPASHVPTSRTWAALSPRAIARGDEHVVCVRAHGADGWHKTSTTSHVSALAFAPNGTLASGHEDGSIFLWPAPEVRS